MTYCAAWTYKGAAYLVADTLATGGRPTTDERTNLNEPQRQIRGDFVSESLLKIRELRQGIAVAIAGDVEHAFCFVNFLSEHIEHFKGLTEVFASATASCGPFDTTRNFELLLVHAEGVNEAIIMKWDSVSCELQKCVEFAAIGSLNGQYKDFTSYVVAQLLKQHPGLDAMLYNAIALIQSYGQHTDLLLQNVGGIICGLRVDRGSTRWQDDTVTIIYRDDHSREGMLSTHLREGIALVNSTFRGTKASIYANSSTIDINQWVARYWSYLKDYLSVHFVTCRRWIFVNKDRRLATVLHTEGAAESASHLLRILLENGTANFEFGPELATALWGHQAAPLLAHIGIGDISISPVCFVTHRVTH